MITGLQDTGSSHKYGPVANSSTCGYVTEKGTQILVIKALDSEPDNDMELALEISMEDEQLAQPIDQAEGVRLADRGNSCCCYVMRKMNCHPFPMQGYIEQSVGKSSGCQ